LFNARDVALFLDLTSEHKLPKINPMPYMEQWLNMNKTQSAPQEQDQAAYKVGSVVNDDENANFSDDF
jgi:ribonucleoside-diphosphate reductase beta chain